MSVKKNNEGKKVPSAHITRDIRLGRIFSRESDSTITNVRLSFS